MKSYSEFQKSDHFDGTEFFMPNKLAINIEVAFSIIKALPKMISLFLKPNLNVPTKPFNSGISGCPCFSGFGFSRIINSELRFYTCVVSQHISRTTSRDKDEHDE